MSRRTRARRKGGRRGELVDPKRFGDPLALETEWTPLKEGGSTEVTHLMRVRGGQVLRFEPMPQFERYSKGMMLLGLVLIVALPWFMDVGVVLHEDLLYGIALLVMGLVVGALLVYEGIQASRRINDSLEFDKFTQRLTIESDARRRKVSLKGVRALQIIPEVVEEGKNRYVSYELNLIFRRGRRLNLLDHRDLDVVREDGRDVSSFLHIPLWDGVLQEEPTS